MDAGFDIKSGDTRASPVVLSVPHAGRDYPPALLAALRTPLQPPVALEDRHVDAVAEAARGARTAIVARRARAWIDLNRGEDERDPQVDEGARITAYPVRSTKVRSGLGLVPWRGATVHGLWRRRFRDDEIAARIVADHRPYHAAVAAALNAARARFGVAVLLDLHSMPPLGGGAPQIVIGDRFGRTAAARFVARIESVAATTHAVGLNAPYAGGHILDRHGAPSRGVHAIQLELDRSLYLDAALDRPGKGLAQTAALLVRVLAALEDEAIGGYRSALAAE
jgi:N-formylglutamate amidohydrolase